jgi:hypothetical protein
MTFPMEVSSLKTSSNLHGLTTTNLLLTSILPAFALKLYDLPSKGRNLMLYNATTVLQDSTEFGQAMGAHALSAITTTGMVFFIKSAPGTSGHSAVSTQDYSDDWKQLKIVVHRVDRLSAVIGQFLTYASLPENRNYDAIP